jgi:hypothetical protein
MTSQRHMRFALTSSLAVIGLLASGCANQTSAYRTQRLGDSPMVITTDGYQRHTLMFPGEHANQWRTCSEAAPDAFSAMSASGAADLGLNTRGAGTEARAKAAMAIAQTAATIERTQTINLLRESMFRTCERYLSGAISSASFVVQAGRDWRAMIAILAIEQLTQSGRPASTVISAGATSTGLENSEDATSGLLAAQERLEAARLEQAAAAAFTCPAAPAAAGPSVAPTADDPAPTEEDDPADAVADDPPVTPAPAPAPAAGAAAPAAAAPASCAEKTAKIEAANKKYSDATADIATYRAAMDAGATNRTRSSTSAGTVNAGGGGARLSPAALRVVAPVVQEIVREAFGTDETQLFCLQILQDRNLPGNIRTSCLRYLMASVNRDTASLFQRANVQEGALLTSLEIADARTGLIELFTPLTPQQYESVRADLGRRLPGGFCASLSKQACIARIEAGEVDDPGSRRVVLTFIAEHAQSGR